jgi:hypothetical protein
MVLQIGKAEALVAGDDILNELRLSFENIQAACLAELVRMDHPASVLRSV